MMDVRMEDHNHSIREMITRIGEIAWEELTNVVSLSYDKIIDEAFEIFEEEQGFKNGKIWVCEDEWKNNEGKITE